MRKYSMWFIILVMSDCVTMALLSLLALTEVLPPQ